MEPKLLSKNWTKLSHEILEDERIPGKYRLQISALYGIIYNGSKSYGYCSFTDEYLGDKIFVNRRTIERLLDAMEKLGYINIKKKIFNNTGSHKTQRQITLLDRKVNKKIESGKQIKISRDLERTPNKKEMQMEDLNENKVRATSTKSPRHEHEKSAPEAPYKETNNKENNKETIENTFLNSLEENSKPKKEYPNSIRQKAIEIDSNIIVNEEGQTTAPVFGKGFSKYSEDLYDL
jgi:DNA-binding transcriptional regulator YhcF (GntR family)